MKAQTPFFLACAIYALPYVLITFGIAETTLTPVAASPAFISIGLFLSAFVAYHELRHERSAAVSQDHDEA